MFRRRLIISAALFVMGCTLLLAVTVKTRMDMTPLPRSLSHITGMAKKPRLLDRHGTVLTTTYTSTWNIHDQKALYDIPDFLQQAFLFSEDKRFYHHGGMDWAARFHALFQNIRAGRAVRGASTITEQVVRLIHPRPRTLWSRWIEGFEAQQLEKNNSKSDILRFYLNQVPYASHRRGIAQAARFYFDRDVETLDIKESLALAVLVRAPDYYDLYRHSGRIQPPLVALAGAMEKQGHLTAMERRSITHQPFRLKHPALSVNAPHFVRFVLNHPGPWNETHPKKIDTTLDGTLQQRVQTLLDTALVSHRNRGVKNGAALVVDHNSGDVLAWAVGTSDGENFSSKPPLSGLPHFHEDGPFYKKDSGSTAAAHTKQQAPSAQGHGHTINAVMALRQPGSAMKPFVYAMALEKGWTPATLIQDTPLSERVGMGMHAYRNYSGQHYGAVTLRNALGNSLNIPAVRTIQFVGVEACLTRLRELGFTTLNQHPDFYGDGLALGNGEVSLYELVQAYTVLANQGQLIPLRIISAPPIQKNRQIFSKEVTSLMGNILSDAGARTLEFGQGGLLTFPVQTAVKTGTSSDYRDAWAMGYNCNFTVGVWMGNLDGTSTKGMTGSRGPAFVLRSIFARLNQMRDTRPLYMSPRLIQREVPIDPLTAANARTEWFIPGTLPPQPMPLPFEAPLTSKASGLAREGKFGFIQPVNGMLIAMDPRIPDDHEIMTCQVAGVSPGDHLNWYLDGRSLKVSGSQFNWPIQRGKHLLEVEATAPESHGVLKDRVGFLVK